MTGYQTFRAAKYGGSFEGVTLFGLGVRARLPFRVFKLDDRIVVDVAHSWSSEPAMTPAPTRGTAGPGGGERQGAVVAARDRGSGPCRWTAMTLLLRKCANNHRT